MTAAGPSDLESRVAALEVRVEPLEELAKRSLYLAEMLWRYGRHDADCAGGEVCSCGFSAVVLVLDAVLGRAATPDEAG